MSTSQTLKYGETYITSTFKFVLGLAIGASGPVGVLVCHDLFSGSILKCP